MAGGGGMTSESVLDDNEGWEGDGEGKRDPGCDGAGDDDGGCEGLDCLNHQFICMPVVGKLTHPPWLAPHSRFPYYWPHPAPDHSQE